MAKNYSEKQQPGLIQLIQITPDQLQKAIISGIKSQLEELKVNFQPKEPAEYLTRSEVAELLSIDLSTVHNWTKKGKLKAYGLGHRVYYKREDLENSIIPIN